MDLSIDAVVKPLPFERFTVHLRGGIFSKSGPRIEVHYTVTLKSGTESHRFSFVTRPRPSTDLAEQVYVRPGQAVADVDMSQWYDDMLLEDRRGRENDQTHVRLRSQRCRAPIARS